jgi:hypothetical protein
MLIYVIINIRNFKFGKDYIMNVCFIESLSQKDIQNPDFENNMKKLLIELLNSRFVNLEKVNDFNFGLNILNPAQKSLFNVINYIKSSTFKFSKVNILISAIVPSNKEKANHFLNNYSSLLSNVDETNIVKSSLFNEDKDIYKYKLEKSDFFIILDNGKIKNLDELKDQIAKLNKQSIVLTV